MVPTGLGTTRNMDTLTAHPKEEEGRYHGVRMQQQTVRQTQGRDLGVHTHILEEAAAAAAAATAPVVVRLLRLQLVRALVLLKLKVQVLQEVRVQVVRWKRMMKLEGPPHCSHASANANMQQVYGARFQTEIFTRGCHWIPRMFARSERACDQWYFSRVVAPFTGWHCKSCHNTEGRATNPWTEYGHTHACPVWYLEERNSHRGCDDWQSDRAIWLWCV